MDIVEDKVEPFLLQLLERDQSDEETTHEEEGVHGENRIEQKLVRDVGLSPGDKDLLECMAIIQC